ncbi:MAG: ATP synthase subunit C [Treponema sp.]|nr:ATP synthase subunit C [Treponema sp.]
MNKKFFVILGMLIAFASTCLFANETANVSAEETAIEAVEDATEGGISQAAKYVAAAIAVAMACLAGGIAVGKIGAAAMGAMAENPEVSGKALPFVGLAEGICLWGMLVAVLILIL